jgi:hypothetical protein
VNSRIAHRHAKALAGSCAFARGAALSMGGLPHERAHAHRESDDRFHPGGRRV